MSRNIAVRPEVGIVVFDTQAAIGAGQGVCMSAVAELLASLHERPSTCPDRGRV